MTNWNQNGWIKGRLTLDADCNDNEWNDDTNSWDEGLEGKVVKLLDLHGNVVATSTTDHDGWYMFDVPPGDYKVLFPKPDGYMFSAKDSGVDDHYDSDANENGMTDAIHVSAGHTIHNVDAGLKPKPHDPDCIIIEAEDMHKNGFKTVDGHQAMGGKLVKLWDAKGSGDLSTHFGGPDGHYDLTVYVQDEYDGQSKIKVKVNGHVVDTIHLDRDSDGGGSNNGGFSAFTLEGVEVNNGDKIVLWADGDDHGHEFVRIDKIELKPGEKPNSPPDAEDDCIAVHEDEGPGDLDGNVLDNDTDPDGDALIVTGVDGSSDNVGIWLDLAKGRVKINEDGSVDFDADGDFDDLNDGEIEEVTVMYDVSDGNGENDWAKLTIKVEGKSPPPDPDCIVLEAETFHLHNFKVVSGNQAMGGKLVKLCHPKGSGDLHKVFDGPDGCYDFSIFVQDESDGQSTIKIKINGQVIEMIRLDRDGDGGGSDNGGFSEFKLSEPVQINNGDKIVLWADGDDHGGEYVRIDKVVLKPVDKQEPPDAMDDCIIVFESETFGDLETLEDGSGSILDNDVDGAGDPYAGAVFSVDGQEANVGEFIDLAGGGRIKINADGTVDFDADGDFESLDEGEQAMVSVEYTIRTPGSTETTERVIDFEGFQRGTIIGTQIDGVTISAQRSGDGQNSPNDAMIFDSANPTGGDFDLGTPNQGNILIISEDGHQNDPDDNAHGGNITIAFDDPEDVKEITFIDTEEGGATITFTLADGSTTVLTGPATANGGIGIFDINLDDVVQMNIHLIGSGAIDDIVLVDTVEVPGLEDTATVKIKILGEDDTGSISGRYFNDQNRDDIENTGDTGVGGATVQLFAQGGAFVTSTTTNPDGTYTFTDVDPGNYFVRFISAGDDFEFVLEADSNTAGADDTNDSDVASVGGAGNGNTTVFDLASGEDKSDVDAGIQLKLGAISGRYFIDENDNSLDDGEPGVPGITVALLDSSNNPVLDSGGVAITTTTGPNGEYTFDDIEPGTYRVGFGTDPSGRVFVEQDVNGNANDGNDSDADPVTGITGDIVVNPGAMSNADAGVEDPRDAAIEGRAFIDTNDDSLEIDANNAPEAGLGGILVTLFNGDDSPTGLTDTTEADGSYNFTGLGAGDYYVVFGDDAGGRVRVEQDAGDDTIDSDADATGQTATFSVGISETVSDVDAGYEDSGDASIEGRAFIDSNDDSLDDDGTGAAEAGLVGITVTLLNGDGSPTGQSTTTNPDGSYSFTGLGAGDYIVEFGDDATGRVLVEQDVNGNNDDGIDSDASTTDGRTDAFSVAISETVSDVDAGYEDSDTASIAGRYFIDQNNNDVDDGEPGLVDVTVTLLNGDGSATGISTMTGANGEYSFTGLAAGSYIVEFANDPAGRSFVEQDFGGNEAIDSDADPLTGRTAPIVLAIGDSASDVDAGVEEFRGSISGRFFSDNNRNDLDDGDLAGDFGIGNATIMLLLADGVTPATDDNGVMITAVTDAETGEYRFDDLLVGDYVVKFPQPPAGSAFAAADAGDDTMDSDVTDPGTGTTDLVTVLPATETADVDAGVQVVVGSISGRYFNDQNRDNIENAGDTGFNAAMVLLFADGGTMPVDSTMTDPDGSYSFSGVAPGNYFVRFVSTSDDFDFVLEGDSATAGADDTNDSDVINTSTGDGDTAVFAVAAGQNLLDVDAGAQVGLGSISGRYFRDNDRDSVDDGDLGGDFGVGNQTVMLLEADGVTMAMDANGMPLTTTTDTETGEYRFDDLLPGDYVVKFQQPTSGDVFSDANVGQVDPLVDVADDSDVINPANGTTGLVTVLANTETADVDAGITPPPDPEFGSISGRLFNDSNEDGLDAGDLNGEFGIPLRTVELLDSNGDAVLDELGVAITTMTNEAGVYQFSDILVGDYIVRFEDPTPFNLDFTTPNAGSDDIDSDVIGLDPTAANFGETDIFQVLANETTEDIDAGLVSDETDPPID